MTLIEAVKHSTTNWKSYPIYKTAKLDPSKRSSKRSSRRYRRGDIVKIRGSWQSNI